MSSVYGIPQNSVQRYLPVQEKRALTPSELQTIAANSKKWIPKLYSSYATPLPQFLSDPKKAGFLGGLAAGMAGLVSSKAMTLGAGSKGFGISAAIAGIAALVGGISSYFARRQSNENTLELMTRLPEGATQRDRLSDPVYQEDLNRRALYPYVSTNLGGVNSGLYQVLGSALANGVLNSVTTNQSSINKKR